MGSPMRARSNHWVLAHQWDGNRYAIPHEISASLTIISKNATYIVKPPESSLVIMVGGRRTEVAVGEYIVLHNPQLSTLSRSVSVLTPEDFQKWYTDLTVRPIPHPGAFAEEVQKYDKRTYEQC